MEHVPPPVERAFANLYRMLKPDGLLLLTVPYTLDGRTVEHFPELHRIRAGLARRPHRAGESRGATARSKCSRISSFHGGDGSTLEMRVFSEAR